MKTSRHLQTLARLAGSIVTEIDEQVGTPIRLLGFEQPGGDGVHVNPALVEFVQERKGKIEIHLRSGAKVIVAGTLQDVVDRLKEQDDV